MGVTVTQGAAGPQGGLGCAQKRQGNHWRQRPRPDGHTAGARTQGLPRYPLLVPVNATPTCAESLAGHGEPPRAAAGGQRQKGRGQARSHKGPSSRGNRRPWVSRDLGVGATSGTACVGDSDTRAPPALSTPALSPSGSLQPPGRGSGAQSGHPRKTRLTLRLPEKVLGGDVAGPSPSGGTRASGQHRAGGVTGRRTPLTNGGSARPAPAPHLTAPLRLSRVLGPLGTRGMWVWGRGPRGARRPPPPSHDDTEGHRG